MAGNCGGPVLRSDCWIPNTKLLGIIFQQEEINFLSLVCIQVLVNTACCVLMLVAKLIQCIVFGPLRVSERQVSLTLGWILVTRFFFFLLCVWYNFKLTEGLRDYSEERPCAPYPDSPLSAFCPMCFHICLFFILYVFFLTHLRINCGHHTPVPPNTSVCISQEQGHFLR